MDVTPGWPISRKSGQAERRSGRRKEKWEEKIIFRFSPATQVQPFPFACHHEVRNLIGRKLSAFFDPQIWQGTNPSPFTEPKWSVSNQGSLSCWKGIWQRKVWLNTGDPPLSRIRNLKALKSIWTPFWKRKLPSRRLKAQLSSKPSHLSHLWLILNGGPSFPLSSW